MTENQRKLITVLVPCYNEEDSIPLFVKTIEPVLSTLRVKYETRILLVNDGSKDNTLKVMKEQAALNSNIRYVSFSRNFGKERALYAGFVAAKAMGSAATIPLDADLQDPPSLIPTFVKYWEEGYEYVYGHSDSRKGQSPAKIVFSQLFYKIYSLLTGDKNIKSGDRDFALLDRKVLDAFVDLKEIDRFNRGVADYVGFKKKRVDFPYVSRAKGHSKFSFGKLSRYALSSFREFSTAYLALPFSFAFLSFVGLIAFVIVGALGLGWWNYIPIGVCAIVLPLSLISYLQMKLEYQTKEEARKRPLYIIADTNVEGLEKEL